MCLLWEGDLVTTSLTQSMSYTGRGYDFYVDRFYSSATELKKVGITVTGTLQSNRAFGLPKDITVKRNVAPHTLFPGGQKTSVDAIYEAQHFNS